jgi:hypothetical protein
MPIRWSLVGRRLARVLRETAGGATGAPGARGAKGRIAPRSHPAIRA